MPKYNGHKNWNHWNVSLWINNDEPLYRFAKECIRRNRTRDEAARDMLKSLPDFYGSPVAARGFSTPDGAPYSVSAIRAAMVGM